MKARGIVVASLTSGSPSSRAGLVTGSGMSPRREPDQTACEVRARAHTHLCASARNPIRTPDNVRKTDGEGDKNPQHGHILTNFSGARTSLTDPKF